MIGYLNAIGSNTLQVGTDFMSAWWEAIKKWIRRLSKKRAQEVEPVFDAESEHMHMWI